MNKMFPLLGIALFFTACAGMKVLKEPPAENKPKPGLTINRPTIGPVTVQKVGFWCEAKKGLLTFGAFGETEEKSKANAQDKCHGMFKDSPCEVASCKPVQ